MTKKIKLLLLALALIPFGAAAETKVKTSGITDLAVTTAKINDNAVTTAKVALDTLTAADLAPDAVGASEIATGAVGADELAAGAVVQVVNFQTGALATGTTVIPYDDTIPQNTEGTEFLSLAITPKKATSLLRIDVVLWGAHSSATITNTVALFQDSGANAIAAASEYEGDPNSRMMLTLTHFMTAGTTSATTFKVRVGGVLAGTFTLNGDGGNRRHGGVSRSSITITEIKQ